MSEVKLIDELRARAQWLGDRHRVADGILMQRAATKIEMLLYELGRIPDPVVQASAGTPLDVLEVACGVAEPSGLALEKEGGE